MDYQIKPIGKTCHATGEALAPGRKCFSTLVERDGQWLRLDFSEEGWTGPPADALAFWKTTVPEAAESQTRPLDPDALMSCFEQLSDDPNPLQEKFRYVLALLLVRKRRLTLEGSRTDGEIEYLRLTGNRGEGTFEVRDQQLAPEEIEQLQKRLATGSNGVMEYGSDGVME